MTTRDRTDQITFSASRELREALEAEAYEHDEPRAATVRRILTAYLRDAGSMALRAPPTLHLGQHNRRYRIGGRL